MRRRFLKIQDIKQQFNIDDYLTFEALEDNFTVSFSSEIEYGIDGYGWVKLKTNDDTPPINTGQTISFRKRMKNIGAVGKFNTNYKFHAKGNIFSIVFGDNTTLDDISGYNNIFSGLFNSCGIVSVDKNFLPSVVLSNGCYSKMFLYCEHLVNAPELPATTLTTECYRSMFEGCYRLTTAPALPATTLVTNCYCNMFYGCSKLNYIKMLATNISAYNCLSSWVRGVASSGTFVKNKNATWNVTGSSGVPSGWTIHKV